MHVDAPGVVVSLYLAVVLVGSPPPPHGAPGTVFAEVETEPVAQANDAADDPAIWLHPTDLPLSTIIGTNKQGSLEVYDLAGRRLQAVPIQTNNVDIRYNFPLGGERITLVAAFSKTYSGLAAFKVNPATRLLEPLPGSPIEVVSGGMALYRSPVSGKYYYFSNRQGVLSQYELFDDGAGSLNARLVRTVEYGAGTTEGVVADDVLGRVYVSEEGVGIWRLSAEPGGGAAKTLVDTSTARGGHLEMDVEGLTIYYKSDGTGYLIASSQGNNSYTVYAREGNNQYLRSFAIAESGAVDGTSETDGIDITNAPLGEAFPAGIFVAQDGKNIDGAARANQNFKVVDMTHVGARLGLSLDTTWDPRLVGR
jgi:3-phytase